MKYILTTLIFTTCLLSCIQEPDEITDGLTQEIEGLKPIYANSDEWQNIITTDIQPIKQLGKIYYKDNLIYVNEYLKGIHIIDNSNPSSPIKIKFIQIPGSKDIAIKGNILYADNVTDLVSLDISDLNNVQEVGRVKDMYPKASQHFPEGYEGSFECVDESQGVVIGWEEATLTDPKCWR